MREKRRKGRVPADTSVEDEIVHLRGLDLKGLRARWRSVLQRPAPDHLPRHLLFAMIAYQIQADRFGDLDHGTRQRGSRKTACCNACSENRIFSSHRHDPRRITIGGNNYWGPFSKIEQTICRRVFVFSGRTNDVCCYRLQNVILL